MSERKKMEEGTEIKQDLAFKLNLNRTLQKGVDRIVGRVIGEEEEPAFAECLYSTYRRGTWLMRSHFDLHGTAPHQSRYYHRGFTDETLRAQKSQNISPKSHRFKLEICYQD